MKIKAIVAGAVAAIYLAIGSWFGYALYISMPALNLAGAAYIAVTWPFHTKAVPIQAPVPLWAFSFKD